MKIEKRGEESYRVRKMYKGKMYTVAFDHKPTQKEAMQAMAKELDKAKNANTQMTFQKAAESYVSMKRQVEINKLVNELTKGKSPKTVRNYHGFLTAVLGTFYPNLRISTTLPQKVKKEPYTPSREDVKRLLEELKDTAYEVPITLACYGMRRSEICALQPEDIEGDLVHINKALVLDENKKWVVKSTKTTDSTRDIIIPQNIAHKIKEQGYVYKGHPNSIAKNLEKTEKLLGIPHFSLHKLRHYFASEMSALGIPEADILKMGGWETDCVMKSVYRHSMMDKEEQAKREAAEKLRNALFS